MRRRLGNGEVVGWDASAEGRAVPDVRPAADVVAVLVSDVHLSHAAPLARALEPDWYAAMAASLERLCRLTREHAAPLVIAGDLFHKWDSPAELISFAMAQLPSDCYAVPGQHDLPHHNYSDIRRTAFWTLVEAGRLKLLKPQEPVTINNVRLNGFHWGAEISDPVGPRCPLLIEVCVAHAFVYTAGTGYQGAPKDKALRAYQGRLKRYDVAHFGDNHKAFMCQLDGGCVVFNPGTLMRRRADDADHRPHAGLLRSDGSVTRAYLDAPEKFDAPNRVVTSRETGSVDVHGLLEELARKRETTTDFDVLVRRTLDKYAANAAVRRIVLSAVEDL